MDYRKLGNGLIFQKHWVYKELINFHLFKMYEEGIIDSLAKKWIRKDSEASCAAIVSTCGSSEITEYKIICFQTRSPRQVSLINVGVLFVILLVGLILSGIVIFFERIWIPKKYKR